MLGSLSLIFQACLGEGEASTPRSSPPATQGLGLQLFDHSRPISSSPGLPASRLQGSGVLTSQGLSL